MPRAAIALLALLLAAPALAREPASPPGAEPAGGVLQLPTTNEPAVRAVIDKISGQPYRGCGPRYDGEGPTSDGRVHGEVMAGVGTGSYRAAGARLCAPLGQDGEVQIDVRHVEANDRRGHSGD